MVNNWAIAIGINEYQFFQPLGCAKADAEGLKDFLAIEGGFSPLQCVLMTDSSPRMGDRSTNPTKENILLLIEDLAARCWQPQDRVWFFFSGYGVTHNGQDYLMPVSGNPSRVLETGIEVRSLLQTLQIAAVDALVLLDINRVFGTQTDCLIGQETIELAKELEIPTILSCQPEQFSRESNEIRHGFFTSALLEALGSGNASTLADLQTYVSVRIPELCQHYWRPTQNPVAVMPSAEKVILPISVVKSEIPRIVPSDEIFTAKAAPKLEQKFVNTNKKEIFTLHKREKKDVDIDSDIWEQEVGIKEALPLSFPPSFRVLSAIPKPEFESPPPTTPKKSEPKKSESKAVAKSPFGQQFVMWSAGSILLLSLVTVVFLRNQTGFRKEQIPLEANPGTANTQVIRDIPNPPRTPTIAAIPPENSKVKQRNQALLESAKNLESENQASDLKEAIAIARKIQPGEPLYEEATAKIKTWNGKIFNLAETRAKQKQYSNAIATAQLIANWEPLYPKAQAAINQWRIESKQYVGNKTVLEAANALIKSGQASSYNRAIEVAKRVPQGQPGYDLAQKSINIWSEKILDLAKRRATVGEFSSAIATATLVPEGTAVYKSAQQAIQKWQKK
jgi:Caspase domain